MDAKTFREYDIRGIVGTQITEAEQYRHTVEQAVDRLRD